MSARRVRPVLYEVARHARPAALPGPRVAVAPTVTVSESPTPAKPSGPIATGALTDADAAPFDAPERIGLNLLVPTAAVQDGRLFISLGWPAGVVLGAAVVLLMVISFSLGRSSATPGASGAQDNPLDALIVPDSASNSGRPSAASPPNGSRIATPPKATTENDPREPDDASPAKPQVGDAQVETLAAKPGAEYIVVQHFPSKSLAAAVKARDYLRQGGVPCVVIQSGRDYVLVATDAFAIRDGRKVNKAEQQRAAALIQRIKDLGKAYIKNGYSFDQASLREMSR